MNACPVDDDLLHFLDGELNAEADARIVAHIEECVTCQERLERLTRGIPALGEGEPIETVQTDSEATADLPGTEDIAADVGQEKPHGDSDRFQPTDSGGETCPRINEATDPECTGDFSLSPAANHDGDTDDASLAREAKADDPDGTATADLTDEPAPIGRKQPASGWPRIPNYEILQRLGEGGMGVVYKARHLGLKRLDALKMIRGGSQARADHLSRFRLEAEAVARLRHPNIIQIYDIGEADGLPFVALELLDGGGLDDRLAGNPQAARPTAELMITLARAVHVAHLADIVHRDLKPTNVLYSSDGVPKVTDFGLAKRIDSDASPTESGQIMGSPSYMAPEQARGHSRKVGPAADVYALGAILYEMLTGRPPFKGETPFETVRLVIDDDPVAPSQLVPRVSRDLETICLKCLDKQPDRRYESAEALADDLARHLRGEPILARRTAFWVRGAKWARRRPMVAASWIAGILVAFGLIAGLFAYQQLKLAHSQSIVAIQSKWYSLSLEADAAQTEESLGVVQNHLYAFDVELKQIKDEPRTKQLSDFVASMRIDVDNRLALFRSQRAERDRQREEQERFARFRFLLSEALFHDTQFTGLDLPSNQDAIRRTAAAALDRYAADGRGDPWTMRSPPPSFSQSDRDYVAEGCYELLLILAEAETTAEQGLRRLDQAARLRPSTRAYHLRRAACLTRAGDKSGADRERTAADGLTPSTAFDHFLAGQERFARKDFLEASKEFDAALQIQPDHFWAQALFGVCSLQLGQPVEAKASLNACLHRESGFAWLYILRGFASGQIAGITRDLVEKRPGPRGSVEPVDRLYAAADSDYGRAMDILDRTPNDELRYSVLVNRGVLRFVLHRDLDEAVGQLQAAIQLRPRVVEAHAALAKVFQSQDKPEDAVEAFSRAIALSPIKAALYRDRAGVDLARAQSTPAQRARALGDLEQAIRLEAPDNPVLARDHYHRAWLLFLDHHDSDAQKACDAAIQVDRNYDDAHRLRIQSLLRLKQPDDVIRSCNPLIARGKATSAIYELRGLAREEIKDFAGAIEDCTNAMVLGGNRAKLLRRRGWLYIVADAPQLARHDFDAAIRLEATNGDAYNGRGYARLRLGEHSQGVADAEKALSLGEPNPDLYYKAARVYAVAAIAAAAEVRKKGRETAIRVSQYQDRAAALLHETLKRLPAEDRPSFLKDVILKDPQLRTLHRRIAPPDLAGPVTSAPGSPNQPAR